jgi:hypothetical protein
VKIDLPRINMGAWSDVRCSKCRQSCNYIGQKLDYPKDSDTASWRALEERVQADRLSDGLPPVDVLARTHASPLPRKVGGRSKTRAGKVKLAKVKVAKVKRGGRGGRPKTPARRPTVKKKVAKKLKKQLKKTPARSVARKSAVIKSRSSKRVLAKRKGARRAAGKRRS